MIFHQYDSTMHKIYLSRDVDKFNKYIYNITDT